MLDYKGIEALYTVIETQNFELAAKKLLITQSAISQRIKGLESYYGEPILIRTLPYCATPLGTKLISLFKKIALLEDDFKREVGASTKKPQISIALNRDSLETWFLNLMEQDEIFKKIALEIVSDDQELTLNYLKSGRVSACISTSAKEIQSGKAHFLGYMEYALVATPSFIQVHFANREPKIALQSAPAIQFDINDHLHKRYLEMFFGIKESETPFHIVPSVDGFKKFALLGYGYALIPIIDIKKELQHKQLIEIFPDQRWKMPLYWHHWDVQSSIYRNLNSAIIDYAKTQLLS